MWVVLKCAYIVYHTGVDTRSDPFHPSRYVSSLPLTGSPTRRWITVKNDGRKSRRRYHELHLLASRGCTATFATVVRTGDDEHGKAVEECFASVYAASETAPTRLLDVCPTVDGGSLLLLIL